MRILQITEKINELAGGTSVHICKLAGATADMNAGPVEIVAFKWTKRHKGGLVETPPNVQLHLFEPKRPYLYGHSREFGNYLKQAAADETAIFHVHNMWRLPLVAACERAYKNGRPCVVSPHGALNPWALTVKSLRKKVMWRLIEKSRLQNATVVHATSMLEADYLASLIHGVPIAMIPPGTDLPKLPAQRPVNERKTALFLSRIAPNKGLLLLLKAWSIIRPKDWKLVVAGSNEGGHQEECQRAARQYGLDDSISFIGSVFQGKKWGPYLSADLFILPTLSENFGIAIAEALASAVPVITTKGAPWKELLTHQCGWWIDIGVEPLVAATREAFKLDLAELRAMGQRGRALIEKKYTWPGIARETVKVYEWAASGGDRPACIVYE
ncbi:MAG TPA: glycosyltransferase [bacterium]|nr:glycosyltransferase [bacterium]